jgi:hypothetical protein
VNKKYVFLCSKSCTVSTPLSEVDLSAGGCGS